MGNTRLDTILLGALLAEELLTVGSEVLIPGWAQLPRLSVHCSDDGMAKAFDGSKEGMTPLLFETRAGTLNGELTPKWCFSAGSLFDISSLPLT